MVKRILIVDDTGAARKMLKAIFENEGYKAFEADDGDTAIERFKQIGPDLVTMDINLITVDGITATQKIKEINPNAKILMISASSDKNKILQSIKAGASNFIVKPIEPNKLIEMVHTLIGTPEDTEKQT